MQSFLDSEVQAGSIQDGRLTCSTTGRPVPCPLYALLWLVGGSSGRRGVWSCPLGGGGLLDLVCCLLFVCTLLL